MQNSAGAFCIVIYESCSMIYVFSYAVVKARGHVLHITRISIGNETILRSCAIFR